MTQASNTHITTPPTWQLEDLYPSPKSEALKKDIAFTEEEAQKFAAQYRGKLSSLQAEELAHAIKTYEAIQERAERLMSYAYLRYAAHTSDEECAGFYQDITEIINQAEQYLLFFTLEINALEEETLQAHMQQSSAFARYAPFLRDVRTFKPYQLEESLEKLLHEKTISSRQAWIRLFDQTLVDMRVQREGETKPLTLTEAFDLLASPHQKTRKEVALAIATALKAQEKTFSLIFNTIAKDKAIEDGWRGFQTPIAARNVENQIEDEVVEHLQRAVQERYAELSHRYYRLKAQWMGQEKLAFWDRNAPLPEEDDARIPWEEARDIVLKAYHDFSPQMAEIGTQFFEKNWIDAAPREGKDSGAFSHPTTPEAHPYILMNYQGKMQDVMTLAHELGHGVHQCLAGKQGTLMADTPLTLAETASVFGEQLTFQALLKQASSPTQRKVLIAGKVEDMLNTVVRQVSFCQFEGKVHTARMQGELAAEAIGEFWMQTQAESLGPAIDLTAEYASFWSYIPHFIHTPFYVYAYAFGDCLVNALYARFKQQPEGFEALYMQALEAGGTLRHKELLAPFGLDTTALDFWHQGLDIISGYIDELEKEMGA